MVVDPEFMKDHVLKSGAFPESCKNAMQIYKTDVNLHWLGTRKTEVFLPGSVTLVVARGVY